MKLDSYYISVLMNNIILLVGVLFTFIILDDDFILNEGNGGTSVIEYSNQLIIEFIILLAISTLFFYILIMKFKEAGMRYLYSVTLISIGFFFVSELASLVFTTRSIQPKLSLILILFITSTFLVIFYIVFAFGLYRISIRNMGITFSSIIGGRIIALYLDVTSIIAISLILIIYDIWNVFRGPLSKLIGKPTKNQMNHDITLNEDQIKFQINKIVKQGTPVVISKETIIGIGDLFLFTIFMYRAAIEWNLVGLVFVFISLNIGGMTTSYLLKRYSPLPALPIPLFFGIITYSLLFIII